jgi:DNA ligase 1
MRLGKRHFTQGLALAGLFPAWPSWPALARSAWQAQQTQQAQAPSLLLAQTAPATMDVARYLVSEKLDGVRAFWDGREMLSRSGQRIEAPSWFSERLPAQALDGELWMARGRFEALSAAVRRRRPRKAEWRTIR